MSLDLAIPLRLAVLENPAVAGILSLYLGVPAIFTKRPVPSQADYPLVAISPDVSISDQDFLVSRNPIVQRDVTVYGQQRDPETYRAVETVGYELREMFHRRKRSIVVPGYRVVDITATGPIPGPVDDEKLVARVVSLTISLQQAA